MTKEKGHPKAAPKVSNDNSTVAQCERLARELQKRSGGMTTEEIRRELDIMAPAPRIYELRWKHGRNIVTQETEIETRPGHKHRGVARYVLLSGKWQGGAI